MTFTLRKTALSALALAAAGLLAAGCTTVGESTNTANSGTPGTSDTSAPGSAPAPAPVDALPSGITTDMAQDLCNDLSAQAQPMRTYTVTVGKVTLNGTVGTWSMRHNLNLVDLAQHREKIDQILETQCPDVRAEVISALQIPDIASGLLGT
ncbi:hypothetical protein [Tomitella biformata]|uniref:hypothetical protein n=1 Tax=Tomitella biformata TaxID=630403 RepID=UPI0004663521|nr:hypothetical protein [Tomitella biformata]